MMIAHRLESTMDSGKAVIIMGAGRMSEVGSPQSLGLRRGAF